MSQLKQKLKKIESFTQPYTKKMVELKKDLGVISNPFVFSGIVILFISFLLLIFTRKKKQKGAGDLERICAEVGLLHEEKTDIPVIKNGEQALDEYGRKIFVVNKHVPQFDFSDIPQSFRLSGVHKTSVSNLYNYINGLLIKLKEANYIENGAGNINPTGIPGEFVINLYDKKKLDQISLLKKIQWYREETINGIKRDYFPEIEVTEDEMVLTLPKELNITDEIIRRGMENIEKFFNIHLKPRFEVSKDGRHIFFKQKPKPVHYFADTYILKSFDLWVEKITNPMREFWKKNLIEAFCFGESIDNSVTLDSSIIVETMANAPHFLNFGATRSGKTKTISSMIVSLKNAYPKSPFYFGDGKKSADYVELARKLSPLPLAGLPPEKESDDPLIELANIVKAVYDIYQDRVSLFQSVKEKYPICSTYQDYNKYVRDDKDIPEDEKEDKYIHRVFLVLDEFGLFVKASIVDADKLANVQNSVFWMLNAILRAGASYGFSVLLNTQRYQLTDMTSEMRSQLVVWLIHRVGLADANNLGVKEQVSDLKPGQFLLRCPGINCKDTGKEFIKCTSPYIGDGQQFSELLSQKFNECIPEKKEFDYSLIYAQQDEESFDKIKPETVQKYIKQVFLVREGYEVEWEKSSKTNFICIKAIDPRNNRKYAIGILDYEEVADQEFLKRLKKENFDDLKSCVKLFFLTGKVGNRLIETQTNISSFIGETYLLSPLDYKRNLLMAIECYNKKQSTALFEKCFDYKLDKTHADDLYEEEEYQDNLVNLRSLKQLIEIKDSHEKGKAFEQWFLAYEKKMGNDTISVDELKKSDLLPDIFANPQADGGIDLVRFVGDRSDKKVIGIQCKNQTSKNLDVKVVSRAVASKELYTKMGLEVVDILIVSTGYFTKQSRDEASFYGIKLIDYDKLTVMIEEFYGRDVQTVTKRELKLMERVANDDDVAFSFGAQLFDEEDEEEVYNEDDDWLDEISIEDDHRE